MSGVASAHSVTDGSAEGALSRGQRPTSLATGDTRHLIDEERRASAIRNPFAVFNTSIAKKPADLVARGTQVVDRGVRAAPPSASNTSGATLGAAGDGYLKADPSAELWLQVLEMGEPIGKPLEARMVVAIEPMLKFSDRGECKRVEELPVVADAGYDLLDEPQRHFLEINR